MQVDSYSILKILTFPKVFQLLQKEFSKEFPKISLVHFAYSNTHINWYSDRPTLSILPEEPQRSPLLPPWLLPNRHGQSGLKMAESPLYYLGRFLLPVTLLTRAASWENDASLRRVKPFFANL
eukprot:TRINITY_DN6895_c0_g1_i12.p1 TRINITY_DN6895_c0_g1~~TRINITY_DN6895_c0_g1_i12.p1  ORF type:complete len:123 (-),score=0.03 TRINITY_DN6895_c0_g1_i12:40-408(-)